MPVSISRVRRWVALAAVALAVVVGGVYFYAKFRVQNALKEVPEKIGIEIQQTAKGFTVSKSEHDRTLFKIEASKAVQFKEGGRTELHDVAITVYGHDSTRFDQIYGADFEYDPQSGNVVAKGEVQIDLEANPEGLRTPDQAPPRELKNPIHLKTSGLIFNQKSGDAYTNQRVEFSIPQAKGTALGASYAAKTNVLTLLADVNIAFNAPAAYTLTAEQCSITKDPRTIMLQHPRIAGVSQTAAAEQATLFLRRDNTLDRGLALGKVLLQSKTSPSSQISAASLELLMDEHGNALRSAVFSGNVQAHQAGTQPVDATAGRALLSFSRNNVLARVRAEENVRMQQHQTSSSAPSTAQDLELTAPAVDFYLVDGRRIRRAETSGPPLISIRPSSAPPGQQTRITAGKFDAGFDDLGQLASVHGAPDARILTSNPGQPDRLSTSNLLDAAFSSGAGIQSLIQQGSFAYVDGERKAWADRARYTPADQILQLIGSPRVVDGGMTSTARSMRMNRITGDAFADGDVRSTYSDLKPQPNGALLASSSPIHVTSRSLTAHRTPAVAIYSGAARLWQDTSVIDAPSIQFDRDQRSVQAFGSAGRSVSTVFVQTDKSGNATPVTVTSTTLTYVDNDRMAHFEGGVTAQGADTTITAGSMDVFLQPRSQTIGSQSLTQTGRLDRIVAQQHVVVTEPTRRAQGERLVYTASEDKSVLTGGPPSIFDAEHGKITGVSLTFYRRDDRVLVEGNNSNPTVTQTRVAR